VASDDDFESFRGAIADLDADRERRIREKFEASRAPQVSNTSSPPVDDDASVLDLVPDVDAISSPSRHTRAVLMGVAAVVVLLALVGAFRVVRNSGPTTNVASGIEDVPLSEVAARAGALPDIDLQAGQVLYLKWRDGTGFTAADGHASGSTVTSTEAWVLRDGSGVTRVSSDFVATGPGDPLGSPLAPRQRPTPAGNFVLWPDTYDAIRAMPSTPEQLVNQFRSAYRVADDAETAVLLSQLLALETTPPAVRAAGFEALAQLGAQPTGRVTMPEGAEGVGYQGADVYGRPWIVVVDPATTAVLGFAIAPGTGDNTFFNAMKWNEYLDQRVEDGLPN
jgi:hypothetical protein